MEIPLTLRSFRPDRVVYGVPRWYRVVMALILAALAAAIATGRGRPGPLTWIILALVALGGLYEENWVFDAGCGQVIHRMGLVFASRVSVIPFAAIERFRVIPQLTCLDLVLECADGTRYLVDHLPVRREGRLRELAVRVADVCAKPLA